MNKKLFVLPLMICLCACSNGESHYESSSYILETTYTDDYKILQLSDIHMANKDNQDEHFDFIKSTVEDANPNMIVITGDNFTFADKATAKRYFEFFESFDIPWTLTFGNHDEQCYFSVEWMTEYLNNLSNQEGSNLLFKDIQDDDVTGNANFAINLKKDGQLFEQLIIMDSNRYYFGDYWGYDWIKEDQINWYCDLVDYTTSQNGGVVVPSLLFFHIPLPEFNDAYNAYLEGNADAVYIGGESNEKVCSPDYNSGLFDKILEKGSTNGVFVGHDHINDWVIKYKGVYLSYGVHSTNRIYYLENKIGGKLITIHNNHSLTIQSLLNEYGE